MKGPTREEKTYLSQSWAPAEASAGRAPAAATASAIVLPSEETVAAAVTTAATEATAMKPEVISFNNSRWGYPPLATAATVSEASPATAADPHQQQQPPDYAVCRSSNTRVAIARLNFTTTKARILQPFNPELLPVPLAPSASKVSKYFAVLCNLKVLSRQIF